MQNNHSATDLVFDFVLENSRTQPIAARVRLYRALAALANEQDAPLFAAMADALEAADQNCHQLTLSFRERLRA